MELASRIVMSRPATVIELSSKMLRCFFPQT
jgi:hypothetical protein